MTVYGGDEINALVLDPGSWYTRFGYAGDDFPKVITPSYYAEKEDGTRLFGDEQLNVPRENCEIKSIITDSIVTDWDAAFAQFSHYFDTTLQIEQPDQPILITEPVWASTEYRQKMIEQFYEQYNFPGLYLAKTPTCVSFQQGRPNCLVVDIGHDSVSVTPVVDGISLLKHSVRTHYAGQFLNDEIADYMAAKPVDAVPSFEVASKEVTKWPEGPTFTKRKVPKFSASFEAYHRAKIWHEFKETALEVPDKSLAQDKDDEEYTGEAAERLFEMPTGQQVPVGYERFQIAESVFDPHIYKFQDTEKYNYPDENGDLNIKGVYDDHRATKRQRTAEKLSDAAAESDGNTTRGLAKLISHTLNSVDIDLRASAAHNIIVTGGTSLVPHLTERLYKELSTANPGLKMRLHAVGNSSERVNQAWIGGSVLASLGTFHQLWVSKQEYEEVGADRILTQRFR
ncbi:hypothetical protein DIURU_003308 [Diutina rugosa]|uniref:Actin-related protein 4 n=1 Tax=Diutina rugosa TaxID=5481 RepID=A0A642UKQ6_DIURU|nr:uncharacterized protein DIURU_003308 [Diutina rugosa]KAA8900938.1 hypothetical protein DIURU_003308 [Diutina rugosa]